MVRDITLGTSGLLSEKIGGPPVMPPQPDGLWVFPFQPANDQWVVSSGEDRYRRSIYTFIRRTARYPSLMVFDAPSREYCAARRPDTNTPLQALTTLNDPAFFEAAQAMAQGELVRVLPRWSFADANIHAVHAAGPYLPARTRAFMEHMQEVLVAYRPMGR